MGFCNNINRTFINAQAGFVEFTNKVKIAFNITPATLENPDDLTGRVKPQEKTIESLPKAETFFKKGYYFALNKSKLEIKQLSPIEIFFQHKIHGKDYQDHCKETLNLIKQAQQFSYSIPRDFIPLFAALDPSYKTALKFHEKLPNESGLTLLKLDQFESSIPFNEDFELCQKWLQSNPELEMVNNYSQALFEAENPHYLAIHSELLKYNLGKEAVADLSTNTPYQNSLFALLNKDLDPTTILSNGMRFIDFLVSIGHVEILKRFVNHDAFTQPNNEGFYLTHIAAKYDQVDVLKFLSKTKLSLAVTDQAGNTCAHTATQLGRINVWRWLNKQPTVCTALFNNLGQKPIHVALRSPEFFSQLLYEVFYQDLNSTDTSGKNILHHLVLEGNVELIDVIFNSYKAKQDLFTHRDKSGLSVLDYAAQKGNIEVVKRYYDKYFKPYSTELDNLGLIALKHKQYQFLISFLSFCPFNSSKVCLEALKTNDIDALKKFLSAAKSQYYLKSFFLEFVKMENFQKLSSLAPFFLKNTLLKQHLQDYPNSLPNLHPVALAIFTQNEKVIEQSFVNIGWDATLALLPGFPIEELTPYLMKIFKSVRGEIDRKRIGLLKAEYTYDELPIPSGFETIPIPPGGVNAYKNIYPMFDEFLKKFDDPNSSYYVQPKSFKDRDMPSSRYTLLTDYEKLKANWDQELHIKGISAVDHERAAFYKELKLIVGNIALGLKDRLPKERVGPLLDVFCTVYRCGSTRQELDLVRQEVCLQGKKLDNQNINFIKDSLEIISYRTRASLVSRHLYEIKNPDVHAETQIKKACKALCNFAEGNYDEDFYVSDKDPQIEKFKQLFRDEYFTQFVFDVYYETIGNENLRNALEAFAFEQLDITPPPKELKRELFEALKNDDLKLIQTLDVRIESFKETLMNWFDTQDEKNQDLLIEQKFTKFINNMHQEPEKLMPFLQKENHRKTLLQLQQDINQVKHTKQALKEMMSIYELPMDDIINTLIQNDSKLIKDKHQLLLMRAERVRVKQLFVEDFYDSPERIKLEQLVKILMSHSLIKRHEEEEAAPSGWLGLFGF